MTTFFQDLRYALRGLAKAPGLAAVVVLSLALAIGANTAVFAWMESFVLRPFPVARNADRMVWINTRAPNGDEWSVSYPTLKDWERGSHTTDGLLAFNFVQVNLRVDGVSDRAWASPSTGNYFDLLGVRALRGRTFQPDDEGAAAPVAVLNYGFWQRRFKGDPAIIGKQVLLNGNGFTVVGVLEPRFGGTTVGLNFDLWVPITTISLLAPYNPLKERSWQTFEAMALLKPGVTFEQARADLQAVAKRVADENNRQEGILVQPLKERGAAKALLPVFTALLGVTLLVLVIACANIANLLLARAGSRSKEIAVRLALGAPRGRIVQQLLTESALLALLGCTLGLLFAWWARNGLAAFLPPAPFPILVDVRLNGRVLLFALALSLVTTLLFGLVPALRASRPDLVPVLKDEVSGVGVSRSLLRSGLVVTQVALALVSLVCAGLFIRSLQRAQMVELGFREPDRLLLATTDLVLAGYNRSTGPAVTLRLLDRVRQLPGVRSATLSTWAPLGWGGNSSAGMDVEGYAPTREESMAIQFAFVSDGYFETMGTTLVKGRAIGPDDRVGAQPVAVVNETFARRFFKDQDPIGKRIMQSGDTAVIVGVVKDGKYQLLTESPHAFVWRALAQNYSAGLELILRTSNEPRALAQLLRGEFASIDASLPFLDPRTMSEQMVPATISQRIGARMLGLFGALALLLSAVGIYGVMAYTVSLRTREIGIRVALGAARPNVLGLIIGQSARLAGIGLLIGAALAVGAGRLLQGMLFGVPATDPLTFLVIGTLLLAVALLASAIPAFRAARIDPIRALRGE